VTEGGASTAATLRYLYARLVNEPFNLSMEQIARLTDRQIFALYFAARDKDGAVLPPAQEAAPEGGPVTFEQYMQVGRAFGVSDEKLIAEWRAKRGEVPEAEEGR
jgi:hypothetical protein